MRFFLFLLLASPLCAQFGNGNAVQIQRLAVKKPLICLDTYVLTYVIANSRFECLAQIGGGGGSNPGGVNGDLQLRATPTTFGAANINQNADTSMNASTALTEAAASAPTFNSGGTTTCNWALSNVCKVVFGAGNTTPAFSNPHGSGPYTLISVQDGVGGRAYTAFPGSFSGASQPDPGAANITVQDFVYDGATYQAKPATCPTCAYRGLAIPEGTVPAGIAGSDLLYAKSAGHVLAVNFNNGGEFFLPYGNSSLGGIAIGDEDNTSPVLTTAKLSAHSFKVNLTGHAMTAAAAYCLSDAGSQVVTVKISATTLFAITCVTVPNFGVTDGSAGYIIAASMSNTAVAANAALDLSGTANGSTRGIVLHISGN